MPGIVALKRRWSIGSDDLVVPATILVVIHAVWIIVLFIAISSGTSREWQIHCMTLLYQHLVGFIVILCGCLFVELCLMITSCRGTIMETKPRAAMQYILYVRLGILIVELFWTISALIWVIENYNICLPGFPRDALLGTVICSWCIIGSIVITVWCTFDSAGKLWVKMQKYQNSLKDGSSKYRYRRSGNSYRNWRHSLQELFLPYCRKAMRQYQDSWNRRCQLLFCCLGKSDRRQNSFAEIAKLLSDFFRDLDVVPSDVIAGLILQRRLQKDALQTIIQETDNEIYQYLSGVPITPETKFLDINNHAAVQDIKTLIHYLHYATAVYGWPLFFMVNKASACIQICPYLRCNSCLPKSSKIFKYFCCFHKSLANTSLEAQYPTKSPSLSTSSKPPSSPSCYESEPLLYGDNCCFCHSAVARKVCQNHNMEIIYASYHVEIGEPPFFVALDHDRHTVVIAIRGTLSLQDIITDLNAEGEFLPTNPRQESWLGHKGMVEAAVYIRKKLDDEKILEKAFSSHPQRGTYNYSLVLVGHSLGAGTASILAIMLRETYSNLVCYAYSPPGGLLSLPAVEYTKQFITSVVLGKDVVPRLGLHQMESLRYDVMNAMKQSKEPKWKTIASSFCCYYGRIHETNGVDQKDAEGSLFSETKELSANPQDSSIALTVHQPLYPPGKIIHIVRNHPVDRNSNAKSKLKFFIRKDEPVYQALWAENTQYDQILISPVMIQDHMPDRLLDALEKLLVYTGPPKPVRQTPQTEVDQILNTSIPVYTSYRSETNSPNIYNSSLDRTPSRKVFLETSFTDLRPEAMEPDDSRLIPPSLKFYNQKPSLYYALSRSRKLDLLRDDWFGSAPIASPEIVSETSSLSSLHVDKKTIVPTQDPSNNLEMNGTSSRRIVPSDTSKPFVVEQSKDIELPPKKAESTSLQFLSSEHPSTAPSYQHSLNFSPVINDDELHLDPEELYLSVKKKLEDDMSREKRERQASSSSYSSEGVDLSCNLMQSKNNISPDSAIQMLPCSQPTDATSNQIHNNLNSGRSSVGGYDFKSLGNHYQSSSSINTSQTSHDAIPPYERSHERLSLSEDEHLCDTRPSSGRLIALSGASALKNNPSYSPKSEMLFHKLKTIDYSSDDIACDDFKL